MVPIVIALLLVLAKRSMTKFRWQRKQVDRERVLWVNSTAQTILVLPWNFQEHGFSKLLCPTSPYVNSQARKKKKENENPLRVILCMAMWPPSCAQAPLLENANNRQIFYYLSNVVVSFNPAKMMSIGLPHCYLPRTEWSFGSAIRWCESIRTQRAISDLGILLRVKRSMETNEINGFEGREYFVNDKKDRPS